MMTASERARVQGFLEEHDPVKFAERMRDAGYEEWQIKAGVKINEALVSKTPEEILEFLDSEV